MDKLLHTFKITAPETAYRTTVEIDGNPLEGVRRVSFEIEAGNRVLLKLEIYGEIIVEGEFRESAIVKIEDTRERFAHPIEEAVTE